MWEGLEYLGELHGSVEDMRSVATNIAEAVRSPEVKVDGPSADGCVELDIRTAAGEVRVSIRPTDRPIGDELFADVAAYSVQLWQDLRTIDPRRAELATVVRRLCLDFTDSEIATISNLNPRCAALGRSLRIGAADSAHSADVADDDDTAIVVIREHPLIEKLNFILALCNTGLPASRIVFIPKEDSTRWRSRVLAQLRSIGVLVIDDEWEGRLRDIVRRRDRSGMRRWVVVDDGGRGIAAVAACIGTDRLRGIETDSGGVARLGELDLLSSVANLADTPAKAGLSVGIGSSAVHTLKTALQHRPQLDELVHVIGYGRIGSHVAAGLRVNGFDVTVSDPAAERRRMAAERSFATYVSAGSALRDRRHRYVFGCSGARVITESDVLQLNDRAVLASISSSDLAPALAAMGEGDRYRFDARHNGVAVKRQEREWLFLAAGHAVNLHLAEGVPEPDFDTFQAEVLARTVEALRR